ncbi:hypothetical protein Dimus_008642, partial [Dionaea muscipula]
NGSDSPPTSCISGQLYHGQENQEPQFCPYLITKLHTPSSSSPPSSPRRTSGLSILTGLIGRTSGRSSFSSFPGYCTITIQAESPGSSYGQVRRASHLAGHVLRAGHHRRTSGRSGILHVWLIFSKQVIIVPG